jgi:hypothetical protein
LPVLNPQLAHVKLKSPIEQQMMGRAGLFRQQNIEKRKAMSVREWAELCGKEEFRAPGVDDIGLHARATNGTAKRKMRRVTRKTREPETAEPEMTPSVVVKEEDEDHVGTIIEAIVHEDLTTEPKQLTSSPHTVDGGPTPISVDGGGEAEYNSHEDEHEHVLQSIPRGASVIATPPVDNGKDEEGEEEEKPKTKGRRNGHTKEAREAAMAERAAKDEAFLETFDPHSDWLPQNTTGFDYTPEFCKELERRYWRNCGLGRPPWYGADMQGTPWRFHRFAFICL